MFGAVVDSSAQYSRARNLRSPGSRCDKKWRRATADPKYHSPAGNFLCIIGNIYYSYFILVLYLLSIRFCLHLLFLKQYYHPLLINCHPAMHICSSQQHPFRYQLPAELKPSHCLINQCSLLLIDHRHGLDH